MKTDVENLSIWWTDVRLETSFNGRFVLSDESFERPVLVIDNQAFLVYKITSRDRSGYRIQDWREAGLSEPSVIKTGAFIPVHRSDMRYRIGCLTERDANGLVWYLKKYPTYRTM